MATINSTQALLQRLKSVLFKQRLVVFTAGLLLTIAVFLLVGIGLSLLANIMILPVWLKVALLLLFGTVTVVIFIKYAIAHLFKGSVDKVAVQLEEKNPELKGRLVAAVQFARQKSYKGFSGELIEATFKQALERAEKINLNQAVSFFPLFKQGRLFAISAVLAIVMLATLPGLFSYSYEVFSNPTTEIAPPLGYVVIPFPGDTEWVKYKDIEIGAAIFGDELPSKVTIHHRLVGGNWQQSEIDLKKARIISSENGDSVTCTIKLRQVNRSFDYYVEAGRVTTEIQKIDVVDRPRVNGIKLSLFYPKYTELPPTVIDENNGSFSAIFGTRVNMSIETNLPVEQALIVYNDSSTVPFKIEGNNIEASLLVEKSQSYYIRLLDHLGEQNPDPIEYYITSIPDEYPSVEVIRPGFDVNLSDEMVLPLLIRIFDDYGFSSLIMKYNVMSQGTPSEENVAVLHFPDRMKTEGDIELNWDMDKLNLFPGDYVIYYFEVADNDVISGPKITKSRQYIARVPSLEEIIAETEGQSAQRITQTAKLLQQGKDISERFKDMARKIQAQNKSFPKTDWQHQKELENLAQQNEELVKNVEKLAEEMDKSVEKLGENAMMSRKIMEKMQQIQKLFEDVATPEMKEAQRKLMEALKEMDQKKIQEAMKDLQMSQEELLKRLERTLALLKKMQLEQKMESMVRKAEQLLKQQQDMNQKTDSSSQAELPTLSPKEDEIKKGLEALKKEVDDLEKLMSEAEMQDSKEAQKFSEALKQTDADKDMQQMAQKLNEKEQKEASDEGKKAASKLSSMLDEMQQQMLALTKGNEEDIKKAMRMAMDDANYLSKSQEELLMAASQMDPQSVQQRELATIQKDLETACSGLKNRISELSKESPFIASELDKLIRDATQQMNLATQCLSEKQTANACRSQREAMSTLNKASVRLMESLNNQKQCDKGGNCNKNISKMESMCNKQNQLNQKTKQQCNNPSNNPSAQPKESRDGLQRLAAEQESIRKSVQELADEFSGSRQILGRLDDIADEMKKIEEDLADGEVGPETMERQLQIYSRMLQASRSLQRKDFTEQRKANTADDQLFTVPPDLPQELLNDHVKLEDRLQKYLGGKYPPQYEEQIKAYFKALLQSEAQFNPGTEREINQ
ncbi:MAG: DUF4175 family protein [bacterium]